MSNTSQDDLSFIREALPAFVSEADEQLASLEHLLLELEENPSDRSLLDSLFRCAHTVKGSAGIFGLDKVVGFTHHVETLLDRMRDGQVALTSDISTLLLQCGDAIRHLVQCAGAPELDDADREAERSLLVMRLQAASGDASPAPAIGEVSQDERTTSHPWHVAVSFGADTFRNGMDPMAILSYLQGLGSITGICCDKKRIPALDALDPETCHLAFTLGLESTATRETIEDAFSFVREDCELRCIEPNAQADKFVKLIQALPQWELLGEMLVRIGAVTQTQLQTALEEQKNPENGSMIQPPKIGELLQQQAGVHVDVVAAAVEKQKKVRPAATSDENRFIRVHADRLDSVINLLGELVTAAAGAEMLARQTRQSTLIEANLQMARLIEEIRNGTLQLRMVQIGETFSRFRRVVRDTAAELGKEVSLEISGGETELDKSVVEKISDPLMHLVRNALDHGLESASDRLASGKPALGTLKLSARHEAGSILILIEDDGRGIHRQRVLQRAWDRGLVEQGVTPADADILKLIFAPGFSTAEQITNLSGRGVGMDVVRSNIEALRGTVQVSSTEGLGTRIQIRLPLTLAIIDGFLVSVAESRFILPLESVVEVVEWRQPQSAPNARGGYCVELRGEVLPVISLRTLYGLDEPAPPRVSVVVVNAGGVHFGIEVDTLLGQHQTVIKPLGRMFRSLRGLSGSSILGNGEVALILDGISLSQMVSEPPQVSFQSGAVNTPTANSSSSLLQGQAS